MNVHVAEWGWWVGTREKAAQKEVREGRRWGRAEGKNRWHRGEPVQSLKSETLKRGPRECRRRKCLENKG